MRFIGALGVAVQGGYRGVSLSPTSTDHANSALTWGPRGLEGSFSEEDQRWASAIHAASHANLILPRVSLAAEVSDPDAAARQIADRVAAVEADGVVVDAQGAVVPVSLVKSLRRRLRLGSTIVAVVPVGGCEASASLVKAGADRLHLNAYDFQGQFLRQFLSPMPILRQLLGQCTALIDPSRLLLGINFYGRAETTPVVGHEMVKFMSHHKPTLRWNAEAESYLMPVSLPQGDAMVEIPSPRFIKRRLELADSAGVGVSVWEGGQGFPAFFDTLLA